MFPMQFRWHDDSVFGDVCAIFKHWKDDAGHELNKDSRQVQREGLNYSPRVLQQRRLAKNEGYYNHAVYLGAHCLQWDRLTATASIQECNHPQSKAILDVAEWEHLLLQLGRCSLQDEESTTCHFSQPYKPRFIVDPVVSSPDDSYSASSIAIDGTIGYVAPVMSSFGIVLLEIFLGRGLQMICSKMD